MDQKLTCESIEKHLKALLQTSVENSERKKREHLNKQPHQARNKSENVEQPANSSSSGQHPKRQDKIKPKRDRKKKNKYGPNAPPPLDDNDGTVQAKVSQPGTIKKNHHKMVNGLVSKNVVECSSEVPLKLASQVDPAVKRLSQPSDSIAKPCDKSNLPDKDVNKRVSVASVLKETGKQKQMAANEETSSDGNTASVRKKKKKKSKSERDLESEPRTPSPDANEVDDDFDAHFNNEFHHIYDRYGESVAMVHKDTVKWLESEFITCLKKQSDRYPDATFYCTLCNYHCNMVTVERHLKQSNHTTSKELKMNEILLRCMPQPTNSQVSSLSKLLEDLCEREGINEKDLEMRQEVLNRLNELVQKELPDFPCKFQLFGSSVSGLGLKSSNVNIDLIIQSVEALSDGLSKFKSVLEENDKFVNVVSEFEAKNPSLSFVDHDSGLHCFISWNNTLALRTARLLGNYGAIDPRVKILAVAVRYWAMLCGVDEQEKGTLPAHSFIIMLIYYLQQCNPPVLPVLHELGQDEADSDKYLTAAEAKEKWICKNTHSVGYLWIDFLRFYSIVFPIKEKVVSIRRLKPFLRAEKKWDGKVIAIEDPMCRKRNLSRSIPNQVVYRYIFDRLQHAYKYFGIPQLKKGALYKTLPDEFIRDLRKYSKKPTVEFNFKNAKKYSVVDESLISSALDNEAVSKNSISKKTEDGAGNAFNLFHGDESSSDDEDFNEDQDPELALDQVAETLLNMNLGDDDGALRRESECSDVLEAEKNVSESEQSNTVTEAILEEDAELESEDPNRELTPCEEFLKELMSNFSEDDLNYAFDKNILTEGKVPPMWCKLCQQKGHLKDSCPSQILPDLIDLPPMTKSFENILTSVCAKVVDTFCPKESEIQFRGNVLKELQAHIQKIYADANLELFGSSCNGFGFTRSDMDICLTLAENPSGEGLDFVKIIENLAIHLKSLNHLHGILPITTAKVPIVKFSYHKELECDISLYNTLAQHNTRMLKLYCEIDDRVQLLGYTLKFFAKLCDIGDASRGSLSSYAYILMALHFLQQRKPPVIPVLQELYDKSSKKPEVIVDGWNAWFFDDLPNLPKVWPEYNTNTESAGELWMGLLRYYTETFNFKDNVITIKQLAPLTRFEKVWNSRSIAIEDPFDLSHNLGVGLSQNMNTYIMKALIRGRELFGTPLEVPPKDVFGFLFDRPKLVVEAPPNDRGCRICSKIGHKMKDCPNRKNQRNRKNSDRAQGAESRRTNHRDNQFRENTGFHRDGRNAGFNGQPLGGNFRQGVRQSDRRGNQDKRGNADIQNENVKNFLNSAVPKQLNERQFHDDRFSSQQEQATHHNQQKGNGKGNSKIAASLGKLNKEEKSARMKETFLHDVQRNNTNPPQHHQSALLTQIFGGNDHQRQGVFPQPNLDISQKLAQRLIGSHPPPMKFPQEQYNNHPLSYPIENKNQVLTHHGKLDQRRYHNQQAQQSNERVHDQMSQHPQQQRMLPQPSHQNNFVRHQNFQQIMPPPPLNQARMVQPQGQPNAHAYSHQISNQMLNSATMQQRIQFSQRVNLNPASMPQAPSQIPSFPNQIMFQASTQAQQNAYGLAVHSNNQGNQNKLSSTLIPDEAQRISCRPPMPSPFSSSSWMGNGQQQGQGSQMQQALYQQPRQGHENPSHLGNNMSPGI